MGRQFRGHGIFEALSKERKFDVILWLWLGAVVTENRGEM
jgi:hypothetical protein